MRRATPPRAQWCGVCRYAFQEGGLYPTKLNACAAANGYVAAGGPAAARGAPAAYAIPVVNPEEISLDEEDEEEQLPADEEAGASAAAQEGDTGETFVGRFAHATNEEIDLGDDDDE